MNRVQTQDRRLFCVNPVGEGKNNTDYMADDVAGKGSFSLIPPMNKRVDEPGSNPGSPTVLFHTAVKGEGKMTQITWQTMLPAQVMATVGQDR
uniref:Uncharacterized protein n=1 Tax=Nelumbo nucifera TaxID=4432 RepID=A0A822XN76_NELNU|nr:TPA_asm: hypothetical protein HUJ06_023323 [Nelumbo nucifera]